MTTITELSKLMESEHKVEFKEAKRNFPYNGGSHSSQEERRKRFLDYIVAFANEGGGKLVLGMADEVPHLLVVTNFSKGKIGALKYQLFKISAFLFLVGFVVCIISLPFLLFLNFN